MRARAVHALFVARRVQARARLLSRRGRAADSLTVEAPSAPAGFRPLDRIVPAVRLALLACAGIHLYGASAYFQNASDLDGMEATNRELGYYGVPGATPDATVIAYENVAIVVGALLMLLFFHRAYANARLGSPHVPAVSHLTWIYLLLSYAPKQAGRSMLADPASFADLRLANALECGGEAVAAIAAILAIVVVTMIGIRQTASAGPRLSRADRSSRRAPVGSGRSPRASRT